MEHKIDISCLPNSPGVYIMRDSAANIIYIGKARALKKRVASYFKNTPDVKTLGILSSLRHIDFVLCESERDALVFERRLINRYKPFYNSMWKDDKSYPYLKLSLNEDFPRLILTRRKLKDGGEYFGPYPQVIPIKKLQWWLTKMFRLRLCRLELGVKHLPKISKVKSCLYLHTGKCPGPCVGKISLEDYNKNVKEVNLFLKAKFLELKDVWEKEMRAASNNREYEKAADLRDRLGALEQMQEKVVIREIQKEDLALSLKSTNALKELKDELKLPKWPLVIEGFDISNISGALAVGSMVRFSNGQPDQSGYRKFRIKTVAGPDDFAMLKEVIYRRYKRMLDEKGKLPDLILVDGGKGQLSAAVEILYKLGLKKTPIVSIAKKEEELFTPGTPPGLKLPKDSVALRLLQRVRDEAHRFGLSYHHTLRKKKLNLV
jgi:excinuclease ABC subunit C